MYIPEPFYRFQRFNTEERKDVNTCMVANLIKLHKEGKGIVDTRLGGGDFILKKEFSAFYQDQESILKNMKLTSIRKLKEISLSDYLKLLREELVKTTYYSKRKDRDESIIINQKNRVAMTEEEIEEGISLGLKLREEKCIK